jgi:hypothetical protein
MHPAVDSQPRRGFRASFLRCRLCEVLSDWPAACGKSCVGRRGSLRGEQYLPSPTQALVSPRHLADDTGGRLSTSAGFRLCARHGRQARRLTSDARAPVRDMCALRDKTAVVSCPSGGVYQTRPVESTCFPPRCGALRRRLAADGQTKDSSARPNTKRRIASHIPSPPFKRAV